MRKTAGRDPRGRFLSGNPGGPGRPRRRDLYTVAAERAAAEKVSLEDELWAICRQLIAEAKAGDVQAAKLLFDRLCGDKDDPLSGCGPVLQVITGVPKRIGREKQE